MPWDGWWPAGFFRAMLTSISAMRALGPSTCVTDRIDNQALDDGLTVADDHLWLGSLTLAYLGSPDAIALPPNADGPAI
jgi:hypothetical protein